MQNRTTIQVSESLRQELRRLAARRDLSYEQLLWAMVELFRELEPGRSLVSIPTDLAGRLNEAVSRTDCRSLSEFVTFVLRLLLYESQTASDSVHDVSTRMRERLEKLGYL
jgi:Arc/MetJ-type ribon-helix-helix transcriptional regulator